MANNLIEITNLTDDLERKVLRFAFFEKHKDFEYLTIFNKKIPDISDLINYNGFVVLPIEGDADTDIQSKKTDIGQYYSTSFDFTINKQELSDITSIELYSNKKGVLFIETSTYLYFIGSTEEPISYTYKENEKTIKISCSGTQRKKILRKKISPF